MSQSAPPESTSGGHPPTKVDCFINPNARAAQEMAETFIEALEQAGIDVTVHWMSSCEQALDDIANLPETDAILVGGGDGTVSGLLPALLERRETIGILPLGTANDFARGAGIPTTPQAAAKVISEGHRLSVDTGLVADRPFLNVASLGISVEIASLHEDRAKKLLGRFAYPIRWAEAWHKHRPLKLKISTDGKSRRARCSLLAVGCGRHYGLWRGTLKDGDGAHTGTARKVTIETASGRAKKVNVDGEIVAHTPINITIRPQSLTIFAPAERSN